MAEDVELTRARRKLTTLRRAERRLVHRFSDIDYELDVLKDEVKALEEGLAQGELPVFTVEDERK